MGLNALLLVVLFGLCFGSEKLTKESALTLLHDIYDESATDPFHRLSKQNLEKDWSENTLSNGGFSKPFDDPLNAGFTENHFVTVLLVGFQGEIFSNLKTTEREMQALLGEQSSPLHTLKGESLPWTSRVRFTVRLAHTSSAARLQTTIAQALEKAEGVIRPLPLNIMDEFITSAYNELHIQTPAFVVINAGRQESGYVWRDGDQQCNTVLHASSNSRVGWIDVNAGPLQWGPISSGDGGIDRHILPFVDDPSQFLDSRTRSNFLASIAGFVARSATQLLMPSVSRSPFIGSPRFRNINAKFILISDHADSSKKERSLLDKHADEVCAALGLAFPGFSNFTCKDRVHVDVVSCSLCDAAIQQAMRIRSSHLGFVTPYLDASVLHHWMQRFLPHLDYESVSTHTLPIIIFHSKKYMLLDKAHQAFAFDDMVVGVVDSGAPLVSHDFFCNSDPHARVRLDPANATRALTSAALDSLWGVAPSHMRFDNIHHRPTVDHLWSVSDTPSSVFSSSSRVSFFVKDAVWRNAIVSAVHSQWLWAKGHISGPDLEYLLVRPLSEMLSVEEMDLVTRRWNVWLWKRAEAESELALYAFQHAYLLVQSMQQDLIAIAEVIRRASTRIASVHDCKVASSWGLVDVVSVAVVIVSFVLSSGILFRVGQNVFGKKKPKNPGLALPRNAAQEFLQ